MKLEEIQHKLVGAGFVLKTKDRNGNDTGYQLRFTNGAIVNVFDNGTIAVQGKSQAKVKTLLGLEGNGAAVANTIEEAAPSRKVFVVYGHDGQARTQLEAMLRRWDLDPLILDHTSSPLRGRQ
jgi:predicted nucleotide-binding protein